MVASSNFLDNSFTPQRVSWIENVIASSSQSSHNSSPVATRCLPIQTKSFLELPGEVRNTIYRYAFVATDQKPVNGNTTKFPGIGLLGTNKQVHHEAASILYGENTFHFGLEIDWRGQPEIKLYGFPQTLPIWPAPCYHPLLKGFKIEIAFTPGTPTDIEAPEIMRNQVHAMRDAYDSVWDDLDIYFRFKKGNLDELTFTMAWIKFRMFEPIAQPNCRVKVSSKVCPLVKWALETTLKQRDLRSVLSTEQLQALADSEEIANDVYEAQKFQNIHEMAIRLAHRPSHLPAPAQGLWGGLFNPFFGNMPTSALHPIGTGLFSNSTAPGPTSMPFSNPTAPGPTSMPFGTFPNFPTGPPPPFNNLFNNVLSLPNMANLASNPVAQPPTSNLFSFNTTTQNPAPNTLNNGTSQPTPNFAQPPPPSTSQPAGPVPSNPFTFPPPPAPFPAPSTFQPQPAPFNTQHFLNNHPNLAQRNRPYRSWEFQDELRKTLTEAKAMELLMKDNEMRICAALEMPGEIKKLSIKKCAVLRSYFALMETAGRITALNRCLEEVEIEKAANRSEKAKGKERVR